MAIQTTEFSSSIRGRFEALLARIGQSMNTYIETRSRAAQIEALESKSDAELAQMGITRDRIVQHVFRDMIW